MYLVDERYYRAREAKSLGGREARRVCPHTGDYVEHCTGACHTGPHGQQRGETPRALAPVRHGR